MKRIIPTALVALAAVVLGRGALADTVPFPAVHVGDVFVIAQTANANGVMTNYFAPGSTVGFRAYAVDAKTHKVLKARNVVFFYVKIPNQPNVKLKYTPTAPGASGRFAWTGSWAVPSDYPLGAVDYRVLVKSKTKRHGSFVPVPVLPSQLTIMNNPPPAPSGPAPSGGTSPDKVNAVIYADSVNGTRPAGAAPRPIGCTQTNVFKRGEQFVLRTWGFDLTSGAVLTPDNVTEAHFTVPGQPNVTLNWGSHGAQKVFFWTNFWNIPNDYALGNTIVHIQFTLTSGAVAAYDYPIVITP